MRGPRPPSSGHCDNDTTPHGRRVVVADDNTLLRAGLVQLLARSGFDVVGEADDGSQLIDLLRELTPDLVVVDNRMPPTWTTEGLDTAREISRRFPSVGILVLSAFVEVDYALELLSGADRVGYLLKSQVAQENQLVDALNQVSRGGSAIDASLVHELMAGYRNEDPLTQLSPDEHDVLDQMAQGRSDAGIAQALGRAEEEVGRQVDSVCTKLHLPAGATGRHRVLAVLAFLEAR